MPHLVKYTKADGQTGDHEVEELRDAIAYVERLRNQEGAESARIFRIDEVSFEFKPYYRVELGGTQSSPMAMPAAAPSAAPVGEAPATTDRQAPAETAPVAEAEAPAAALMAEVEPTPVVDPWVDAPPPPVAEEGEPAGTNGRRGLFGR